MVRATLLALAIALATASNARAQNDAKVGESSAHADAVAKQPKAGPTEDAEVTGNWRVGKGRGPSVELRKSDDVIFGKRQVRARYAVTYELERQPDGTYRGLAAEEFSCYEGHFCRTETPMHITALGSDRIEGHIFGVKPPKGLLRGMKYCDTCGKSEEAKATWQKFVWLRERASR